MNIRQKFTPIDIYLRRWYSPWLDAFEAFSVSKQEVMVSSDRRDAFFFFNTSRRVFGLTVQEVMQIPNLFLSLVARFQSELRAYLVPQACPKRITDIQIPAIIFHKPCEILLIEAWMFLRYAIQPLI